ncbi:MAG: response regulator [Bdellovibrionota bacterium]
MKPTLIIADDLEEIREKLYNVLLEDFEILADVENGQKAVEAVRRYRPQLVLMDVVMPVLSGIEAVRPAAFRKPGISQVRDVEWSKGRKRRFAGFAGRGERIPLQTRRAQEAKRSVVEPGPCAAAGEGLG